MELVKNRAAKMVYASDRTAGSPSHLMEEQTTRNNSNFVTYSNVSFARFHSPSQAGPMYGREGEIYVHPVNRRRTRPYTCQPFAVDPTAETVRWWYCPRSCAGTACKAVTHSREQHGLVYICDGASRESIHSSEDTASNTKDSTRTSFSSIKASEDLIDQSQVLPRLYTLCPFEMWDKALSYPVKLERTRREEYPVLQGIHLNLLPFLHFCLLLIIYPDQGTTYLDHAGTTPYAKSLIEQFSKELSTNLFGNPHSASPSSSLATKRIQDTRSRILDFFKADPEKFDIVFVANATAAIKLVMDAFRDHSNDGSRKQSSGFPYYYHRDCHTSLVGVREVASSSYCFDSDEAVEKWLAGEMDPTPTQRQDHLGEAGLFAYPAQSNMNGHRLPLNWSGQVRRSSCPRHKNLYTLLDAAAYVTTAQLDLSDAGNAPDFTALSFYKIFGYPDLGALIVRKAAGHVLQKRKYFGGGTVDMVTTLETEWHAKKTNDLHEQLEDGTLPFHNIIALDHALDVHKRLYGSMDRISQHTCHLAKTLYDELAKLQYPNGVKVCEIYKDSRSEYGHSKTQGPTIAFNVRSSQGDWIGKSEFEQLAILANIQLRSGGVCNPGGIASSLGLATSELLKIFNEGGSCSNNIDIVNGKPTGIVRASLGAMSTMQDVNTLIDFVKRRFIEGRDRPGVVSELQTPREPSFLIDSLKIYPVKGCPGWKIPASTTWDIKAEGLAWDQEWCLVSLMDGLMLRHNDHPKLALLRPSVVLEKGTLKVEILPEDRGFSVEPSEVSVSLWEMPGKRSVTGNPSLLLEGPPGGSSYARPYDSIDVANFFTSAVGVPCTLARLQIHRSYGKQVKIGDLSYSQERSVAPVVKQLQSKPQSIARSITIKWKSDVVKGYVGEDEPRANIVLHPNPASGVHFNSSDDWQYLQIGPHYFQISSQSPHATTGYRHIIHLPNRDNGSLASKNPIMKIGDLVRPISIQNSKEEKDMQSCVQHLAMAGLFTPPPTHGRLLVFWKSLARYIYALLGVSKKSK